MANKIDKIDVGGAEYEINLPDTATPTISSLTVTGNLTCSGTANLSVISCDSVLANDYLTSKEINTNQIISPSSSQGKLGILSINASDVEIHNGNTFSDNGINIKTGNSSHIPEIEVLGGLNIVNTGDVDTGQGINIINNSNYPLTISNNSSRNKISVYTHEPNNIGFLFTISNKNYNIYSNGNIMNFDIPIYTPLLRATNIGKGSYTYSLPNKSGTIALLDDVQGAGGGVELYQYDLEAYISGGGDNLYDIWFTAKFFKSDKDIYQEGVNQISSMTSLNILISHIIKQNQQYENATGWCDQNNVGEYLIYGVTYSTRYNSISFKCGKLGAGGDFTLNTQSTWTGRGSVNITKVLGTTAS